MIRATASSFAIGIARVYSDKAVRKAFERACGEFALYTINYRGKNCRIHGFVQIVAPDRLRLGDHVRIGKGCFLFCKGGLTIGDNTQISKHVTIYTANHDIRGHAIPYDDKYVQKPVHIGRSVWIGMHVCITPGVTVGDGAVIGMGSVISKSVPPGAVVVSNRQRVVGRRDMESFGELDNSGRYFGSLWPDK